MSIDTAFIADGKSLGYGGKDLVVYVDSRKADYRRSEEEERALRKCQLDYERERESVEQDAEREKRAHERELRAVELAGKKLEEERKGQEAQLEIARLQYGNGSVREPLANKSFIKLAGYADGEDVAIYLNTFERVKEANQWSDGVAIPALMNGFTNTRVSLFLSTLPPNSTYEEIRVQILKSFGFTIYDYQTRFRNAVQRTGSFRQFVLYLQENMTRMCAIAEVDTIKKLEELFLKDQILRSADRSLAEYLKERDIFRRELDSVIQMADNFQAIHKPTKNQGSVQSNVSGRFPTVSPFNQRSSEIKCLRCGKTGHIARYCRATLSNFFNTDQEGKEQRPVNVAKDPRECYSCGLLGHFARACPTKGTRKNGQQQKEKRDMFVSVNASLSDPDYNKLLPVSPGMCNGRRVQVLRDTGATAVLVRRSLVPSQSISSDKVKLAFADEHSVYAPKAVIDLQCPFYTGKVEALCLAELPFDVLLGNIPGATCACGAPRGLRSQSQEGLDDHACYVQTRAQTAEERKPGRMPMPTRVSCMPIQFDLGRVSAQDMISMQDNDPSLKSCLKKTEIVSNTYPRFVSRNGVLVRLTLRNKHIRDVIQQIVLPKLFRIKVMKLAHDTIMSGHMGTRKTQNRITNHFYWPGCYEDVRRYCQSCEICQIKVSTKPPRVPLINLPLIGRPFERVAIDIIGPLPKSSRGNRFALVSVDLATKYPDAIALRRLDSETVAEALLEIYSRVGLPNEILHDQGTNFMSSVMRRFNEILKIKRINTTPWNPKCNGSCEGFNKCLKQMLKKISDDTPQTWDRFLQPLLFAYREVPHTSTGFSPFELLFGYEVRGPLFLIKEKLLDNCETEEEPITTYVLRMRERIREFMKISNANEGNSKRKQKLYYDRSCKDRKFMEGDRVLLLLPTSTSKLIAEWKGPYDVVRRLNKVDYVVRVGDREKTYHINMLKKFFVRPTHDDCSEEGMQVANAVVTDQVNGNVYEFGASLSTNQVGILRDCVNKFSSVFNDKPGRIVSMAYNIEIDPKVKPCSSRPYKVPFHLKEKVKCELDKWVNHGVIRKSTSEWASPVVIVKTAESSIRLTVDYRLINPHVRNDNFPMPTIDMVIERLSSAKIMTKLDLTKAYWQIPLTEESCKYTSFVTEFGQFEFTALPMGIRPAASLCSRIMKEILVGCDTFVTNFIDDVVVYSSNFDEHVTHLSCVMGKFSRAGVTLNVKKCMFAQNSVKFLGFIIGGGTIKPNPVKVSAIRNFPKPTTKKELRSFLGLLNFYRRFLPNLSSVICPLTNMLRKAFPDKLVWPEDKSNSFRTAVRMLSEDVSLTIPKPNYKFVLHTDACDYGIGAVLCQEIDDHIRPISFVSRKLNKAEMNYSVIEKECLAIRWAISRFSEYLYGGKFIVKTDHAPLQWLRQNKNKNSRLMRWALELQQYDFSICYIRGSENLLADLLSRYPSE